MHGSVPREDAVTSGWTDGRGSVRLAVAVTLPDAVGTIGMARRAIHHAKPKHAPRPLGREAVVEHFVAGFAIDHGHYGFRRVGFAHSVDRRWHRFAPPMRCLEHVEIQQRG